MNFDGSFGRLIDHEGGYVNDPADPGGETKYGISKRSYPQVDIKNLSLQDAKNIYYRDFWQPLGDAHPAIKFQAFDFAVNSGIQTAIRKLQAAVDVADDGHWGPRSAAALQAMELNDVLMRFASQRLRYMTKLKNWPQHGAGWANRIAAQLYYAAEDK